MAPQENRNRLRYSRLQAFERTNEKSPPKRAFILSRGLDSRRWDSSARTQKAHCSCRKSEATEKWHWSHESLELIKYTPIYKNPLEKNLPNGVKPGLRDILFRFWAILAVCAKRTDLKLKLPCITYKRRLESRACEKACLLGLEINAGEKVVARFQNPLQSWTHEQRKS